MRRSWYESNNIHVEFNVRFILGSLAGVFHEGNKNCLSWVAVSAGIEVQSVLISLLVSFLCFFSPSGKKFRSKPQLARYLGSSMDLSTFDFRTGKMLMNKMNKNRQRMRYDCSNQAKVRIRCSDSFPLSVCYCTGQTASQKNICDSVKIKHFVINVWNWSCMR